MIYFTALCINKLSMPETGSK